jgi:serine/threonine-protein kinase HipA
VLLCLEDFCSLLDLGVEAKYEATIERVARQLRGVSTDSELDLLTLFRRTLFAWLVADGDMHLKNMALIKTAAVGDKAFRTVTMAPVYDTVTTRVFPMLKHDRMALKLNGKDDRLQRSDFTTLARTIGLSAEVANRAIDQMAAGALARLGQIRFPKLNSLPEAGGKHLDGVSNFVRERAAALRG